MTTPAITAIIIAAPSAITAASIKWRTVSPINLEGHYFLARMKTRGATIARPAHLRQDELLSSQL
jgi:hypothetical protein